MEIQIHSSYRHHILQQAFSTVSLDVTDGLLCAVVASPVPWVRELTKIAAGWSAIVPGGWVARDGSSGGNQWHSEIQAASSMRG